MDLIAVVSFNLDIVTTAVDLHMDLNIANLVLHKDLDIISFVLLHRHLTVLRAVLHMGLNITPMDITGIIHIVTSFNPQVSISFIRIDFDFNQRTIVDFGNHFIGLLSISFMGHFDCRADCHFVDNFRLATVTLVSNIVVVTHIASLFATHIA